jgi:hypothetical protein
MSETPSDSAFQALFSPGIRYSIAAAHWYLFTSIYTLHSHFRYTALFTIAHVFFCMNCSIWDSFASCSMSSLFL